MDDKRKEVAKQENPPHLFDEYHKARHRLALFTGVLLAYETVGLSVGKDAGPGAEGVIIPDTDIALSNPEGIPGVLVMLIAYCGFRMGVEWWQCEIARRNRSASIIDLVAAYAIAIFAVTVSALQQLTDFRLASAFASSTLVGAGIGFFVLAPAVVGVGQWIQREVWETEEQQGTTRKLWTILSGSGIAALLVVGVAAVLVFLVRPWPQLGSSLAFGMAIGSSIHGFVLGILVGRSGGSPFWWKRLRPKPVTPAAAFGSAGG